MLGVNLHRGSGLAQEPRRNVRRRRGLRQKELERHALLEVQMRGGDDDAHPSDAEDSLDAVLAGDDVPFLDRARGVAHGHERLRPSARRAEEVRTLIGCMCPGHPAYSTNSAEAIARRPPRRQSRVALPADGFLLTRPASPSPVGASASGGRRRGR